MLTIPTRIPRDPRDIPPLPEMPAYAWTVLSLTLAQVCGWCRGLGLELVCTHETKWTYTYTTKHKTPTKLNTQKPQGAYLLACEMVATLLDIVALSPMLLGA